MKIFIADDHPILLEGLEKYLLSLNLNVIGKSNNGRSALNFIIKNEPDIAVLDIEMPLLSGIEIAEECYKQNIQTKIVLITYHKEIDFYERAKQYNIFGYLLKEFALEEIKSCISSVKNNTPYFSKKIIDTSILLEESRNMLKSLTLAELRILKHMSLSKTSKEISELLCLSPRTIEKHRSNIIDKLNLPKVNRSLNKWVEKNRHLF